MTSCRTAAVLLASHAGLFRGARISSLPTNAVCGIISGKWSLPTFEILKFLNDSNAFWTYFFIWLDYLCAQVSSENFETMDS